jgi:hypothetical protein
MSRHGRNSKPNRRLRRAMQRKPPLMVSMGEPGVDRHAVTTPCALGRRLLQAGCVHSRLVVRLDPGDLGYPRPVGYCMDPTRYDDCLRPCVATVLQVDVRQVPDPQIDARLAAGDDPNQISHDGWTELAAWLEDRGFDLVLHADVPVDRPRWIGVREYPQRDPSRPRDHLDFHCIVTSGDRPIFDPMTGMPPPSGHKPRPMRPDLSYGISFEPRSTP